MNELTDSDSGGVVVTDAAPPKWSRRAILARSLFYGTPVLGLGYGTLLEKNYLSVTRKELLLAPRFSALEGIKIALMADFHHDDFGSDRLIRRAVACVNKEEVDVVMLAGDFISEDIAGFGPLFDILRHLKSKRGVYAVYGNHDREHFDPIMPSLISEAGVVLLENEFVGFKDFCIAGLDSAYLGIPDMEGLFARMPGDKPMILGWHEPDSFRWVHDERVALQLSGHTHGGQIRVPFYGPLVLPPYGRRYPYGHYQRDDKHLFVTRGVGTLNLPARFCCPPEVVLLTLTTGAVGNR